jgi:hypothetical protein
MKQRKRCRIAGRGGVERDGQVIRSMCRQLNLHTHLHEPKKQSSVKIAVIASVCLSNGGRNVESKVKMVKRRDRLNRK